uniref:Regulatory protein zeste n=1 Tax=Diabrotica virgifera virgifera TaxID=50390 RepID=A0A6P7FZH8_DIAVI
MDQKKRLLKVTEKQKKVLVEYIKTKPQLSSGRFTQDFSQKDSEQLWEDFTNTLNSMGGAIKPIGFKCWQDIRSRTKVKMGNIKKHQNKTGGGPPIPPEDNLTSTEEDVYSIIKEVSVEGHTVEESMVSFDFNSYTTNMLSETLNSQIDVQDGSNENNQRMDTVPNLKITNEDPQDIKLQTPQKNENRNHRSTMRSKKKRIPKKRENFMNASAAATTYKDYLNKKSNIKKAYYREKINIMKTNLNIKRRKNIILQNILEKLSTLAEELI